MSEQVTDADASSTREALRRDLDGALSTGQATGRLAVLMMHLEGLRDVNAAFGWAASDAATAEMAARLASLATDEGWHLVPIDGGTFGGYLPSPAVTSEEQAAVTQALAQRVQRAVRSELVISGQVVHLDISIGLRYPEVAARGHDAADLLVQAEVAMYRAERLPGSVAVFDPQIDGAAMARLSRIGELRRAIDQGELLVHYQPVVDLDTGAAVSVEALVRWDHPERGLVLPGEFIPLAEECGLVSDITRCVLDRVIADAGRWRAQGWQLPCAVNLSVRCLNQVDLIERLVGALPHSGVELTVEVTESVLADEGAITVLRQLDEAGVPCATDDFGSGYSSLGTMKHLPISLIKLDRSLVRDVATDDRDALVARAALVLGRALGLQLIAEGVEDQATVESLRRIGYRYAQGFGLAPPMAAELLTAWMSTRPPPEPALPPARAIDATAGPGPAPDDQLVLFYEKEEELLRELLGYVEEHLSGEGHVIVITGPARRRSLMEDLPAVACRRALATGRLVLFDADETLSSLMRNGSPDPELVERAFDTLVGPHLRDGAPLALYGDMVASLWADGNIVAALQLEELWNGLPAAHPMSLLSAYPVADVQGRSDDGLARICHHHTSQRTTSQPSTTGLGGEASRVLVDATRELLRVETTEECVGVLLRAVSRLGGSTTPGFGDRPDAIPIDLSLGRSDELLPTAPLGSPVRLVLERFLPGLVEDARAAATRCELTAHLAREVFTDPLTGLGNRRSLEAIRGIRHTDSVALVDLDHFRTINDTAGHDGGNRLLVAFSRALRLRLRSSDRIFRVGSDQFAILFTDTTPEAAGVALEGLRQLWQEQRPYPSTFSAGVAAVTEGSLHGALLAADLLVDEAKRRGRDGLAVAPGGTLRPSPDPAAPRNTPGGPGTRNP